MEKFVTAIGCVVLALVGLVALSALQALPVKWLWNVVCIPLFDLPGITFIQAWGLSILCGILFKSATSINTK